MEIFLMHRVDEPVCEKSVGTIAGSENDHRDQHR